jgi:hypothetical protein
MVGIGPHEPSIARLIGAFRLEQEDDWQLQRRCAACGLTAHRLPASAGTVRAAV